MEIELKYPLKNYEVISYALDAYLKYPNKEDERDKYFAHLMADFIFKSQNLSNILHEHSQAASVLLPLSHDYKSPPKGYRFLHASIAGHVLLAMIRMKISNIEPTVLKASYLYIESVQNDPNNIDKKKKNKRQIKEAWSNFKSVAHITLVAGAFGDNIPMQQYPSFLASLYCVQKIYLDILEKNKSLDVDIWKLPNLDKLYWDSNEITPPKEFMQRFNNVLTFDALSKEEETLLSKYSNSYFD